jgi:hypothetical protein
MAVYEEEIGASWVKCGMAVDEIHTCHEVSFAGV